MSQMTVQIIPLYRVKCLGCGTRYASEHAPEACSCGCQFGVYDYDLVEDQGQRPRAEVGYFENERRAL